MKETETRSRPEDISRQIKAILSGRKILTDDMRYDLHVKLSEMAPDEALMAMALAAGEIGNACKQNSTSAQILNLEARRISDYHRHEALSEFSGNKKDIDRLVENLNLVAEDLRCLEELLALCSSYLRRQNETAAALCYILDAQAASHALITEELLEQAAQKQTQPAGQTPQAQRSHFPAGHSGEADNVVAFPGCEV